MQPATIDKSKNWTVEDFLLLGEINTPCELINGELIMSPSSTPNHQLIAGNLYDFLKAESKRTEGIVLFFPIDLYIDEKNVLQPDLIYVSKENKRIISQRGIEGTPELIVEIISPSSVFSDRKKKIYKEIGVKESWILDPANRTLEIYLSDQVDPDVPHLYLIEEGAVKSTVLINLSFDLKELFS